MTGLMFPRQLPPSGAEGSRVPHLENLGVRDTGPEERFDRIALLARMLFDVAGAGIAMANGDDSFMKASIGLSPTGSPESAALARLAMSHPEPKVVEETPSDHGLGMLARRQAIRFYAGQPVTAPDGGQVGTLFVVDDRSRTFSERDQKLLAELEWWVEREFQHSAELDQAAEVQRKLMPERGPEIVGYEFAGVCVPCRGVGGDFFDWYYLGERGLGMTLGDVMGKGLAAAMVMSVGNSVMRAAGRQYPPAEAVEFADLALQEELESTGTLITLWHAELNPLTHVIRYVDAGHGLMVGLSLDGSVRRRPAGMGSLPLGVMPGEQRPEMRLRLEPGEVALVFSDGLLDLYDGTIASIDVIAEEARAVAGQGAQAVVDYFAQRAADNTIVDDVTVCAIRRSPA